MTMPHRTAVIAGATSAAGRTVVETLLSAGVRVVATGRSAERLALLPDAADKRVADATSLADMTALAHALPRVDAVIPLVGGWYGTGTIEQQSDDGFAQLFPALQAVRATARAFYPALIAAPAGRFAVVSSTAVARPTGGGADYAAVKSAVETWTQALAHSFAREARARDGELLAAATVFRARGALGAADLADATLWMLDAPASDLNDHIIELPHA
ncbi:SDR family NAD(P)-dependent oxidoreductase [Microbacterium sp. YY-01]|uniref:SDR family NAD(P)-dependent oxidoreductase n=1 Tax=Microbacterium sp. YY-01 TaxID=3421634 RepID=UPI003D17BDB2